MDASLSGQVVEYYQNLSSNQAAYYNAMTTWLGIFFAIFTGTAFIWKFVISNKSINNKIKKNISKKINIVKKNNTKEIDNLITEKIKKISEELIFKNRITEARFTRMFGVYLKDQGSYVNAFVWFYKALDLYINLNNEKYIRIMISNLIEIYEKHKDLFLQLDSKYFINNNDFDLKDIRLVLNKVTNVLYKEKKVLLDFIDEIENSILKK